MPGSRKCPGIRCGIDTVEIPRFERLLESMTSEDLARLFAAFVLRFPRGVLFPESLYLAGEVLRLNDEVPD